MVNLVFRFSQLSEIALESYNLCRRKADFSERDLPLKGLKRQEIREFFCVFFTIQGPENYYRDNKIILLSKVIS